MHPNPGCDWPISFAPRTVLGHRKDGRPIFAIAGGADDEPTLLDLLKERRDAAFKAWSEEITKRETADGDFETRKKDTDEAKRPTEAEVTAHRDAQTAFSASIDGRKAELVEFDKRIAEQVEVEKRRNDAAEAAKQGGATVTSEPLTYRRDNAHEVSYYADLALSQMGGITLQRTNKTEALVRLNQHAQEMSREIPKRIAAAEARAEAKFAAAEARSVSRRARSREDDGDRPLAYDPFQRSARAEQEQRVTPNRTDGFGGYLVPPLWLPEDLIPGLRAQSVARNLCRQLDLPMGTDSINIPKLANLTAVGYQQADNAGILSQDWTDTFVQANVKTAAGQSDVAIQLLEQSPHGLTDEVITTDLMAAHDQFVGLQVIQGDGVNTAQLNGGHIAGIYPTTNWANTNVVTYTDVNPSGQHFGAGALAPLASKIAKTRFDVEDFKIVLHGRRWFWYSSANDVNGRPLGETLNGGRYNSAAAEGALAAYGQVGTLPYVADAPVYVDNNIPTADTTGGGTGQDIAIGALWDDLWLFMSDMRTRVLSEVNSGNLGVRFQVYSYFAFLARYGQSIAVASGSGFAAPSTGFGDTF